MGSDPSYEAVDITISIFQLSYNVYQWLCNAIAAVTGTALAVDAPVGDRFRFQPQGRQPLR